jgi:hypothetical protein
MQKFEFLGSLATGKKKNRNREIIEDNLIEKYQDYLE